MLPRLRDGWRQAHQASRVRNRELPTPPSPVPALRRQARLEPATHPPTLKRGEHHSEVAPTSGMLQVAPSAVRSAMSRPVCTRPPAHRRRRQAAVAQGVQCELSGLRATQDESRSGMTRPHSGVVPPSTSTSRAHAGHDETRETSSPPATGTLTPVQLKGGPASNACGPTIRAIPRPRGDRGAAGGRRPRTGSARRCRAR